jgi:hypothetical protein
MVRSTLWSETMNRNGALAGERQGQSRAIYSRFRSLASSLDLVTPSFSVAC